MAVPKKKTSKSRTRTRRAHQHLTPPNVQACEKCKEIKLPHQVCPSCGYYRGTRYTEVETASS